MLSGLDTRIVVAVIALILILLAVYSYTQAQTSSPPSLDQGRSKASNVPGGMGWLADDDDVKEPIPKFSMNPVRMRDPTPLSPVARTSRLVSDTPVSTRTVTAVSPVPETSNPPETPRESGLDTIYIDGVWSREFYGNNIIAVDALDGNILVLMEDSTIIVYSTDSIYNVKNNVNLKTIFFMKDEETTKLFGIDDKNSLVMSTISSISPGEWEWEKVVLPEEDPERPVTYFSISHDRKFLWIQRPFSFQEGFMCHLYRIKDTAPETVDEPMFELIDNTALDRGYRCYGANNNVYVYVDPEDDIATLHIDGDTKKMKDVIKCVMNDENEVVRVKSDIARYIDGKVYEARNSHDLGNDEANDA